MRTRQLIEADEKDELMGHAPAHYVIRRTERNGQVTYLRMYTNRGDLSWSQNIDDAMPIHFSQVDKLKDSMKNRADHFGWTIEVELDPTHGY